MNEGMCDILCIGADIAPLALGVRLDTKRGEGAKPQTQPSGPNLSLGPWVSHSVAHPIGRETDDPRGSTPFRTNHCGRQLLGSEPQVAALPHELPGGPHGVRDEVAVVAVGREVGCRWHVNCRCRRAAPYI